MGNGQLKIFLSYHKNTPVYKSEIFQPIHVGAVLHDYALDFAQNDDAGKNISELNPYYCELTGHYWVLKNYLPTCDDEYIGFAHYRRLPDLMNISEEDTPSIYGMNYSESLAFFSQLNSAGLSQYLSKYDVVLPCTCYMYENTVNPMLREDMEHYNLYDHFCLEHKNDLLDTLKAVFMLVYPDDVPVLEECYKSEKSHFYNIYYMKTELLKDFLEWQFEILEYMNQAIGGWAQIKYNRMAGFVAELLINVWLKLERNKNLKIGYAPIYMIDFEAEYIQKANEYHSQGLFNEAIGELKKLLEVASDNFSVAFSIAELSLAVNNVAQSKEYFTVSSEFAYRADDYFRLAMLSAHYPDADYAKTSELYEKAINAQPDEKFYASSYLAFSEQLHDINMSAQAWKFLLNFELTPEEKEQYEKFKKVYDMVNK